jgi:hypothetical protein
MSQTSARREGINHTADNSAIRLFSLSRWGRAAVPKAALPLTLGIDRDDHWLPAASFDIGQKYSRRTRAQASLSSPLTNLQYSSRRPSQSNWMMNRTRGQ